MLLLVAVVLITLLELFLWRLVHYHRRSFQWLIGTDDVAPDMPADLVEAYVERSLDSELGWVRKPNTSGRDKTATGDISFHVAGDGARVNPGFEGQASEIAVFGDSFAFCRLVEDAQTWPHYLSRLCETNVRNFGVGNYGFDQALLRFEREAGTLRSSLIIIAVVPETIARIHSYWKHYFEYGNILAFKPRFTLEGDNLCLQCNPISQPRDFSCYQEKLPLIQELDPFYRAKFRRDLLRFPFVVSVARRTRRHIPILWHLSVGAVANDRERRRKLAFEVVVRENAATVARLYADPSAQALFRALVNRFAEACACHGKRPLLLILPQPIDLVTAARHRCAHRSTIGTIASVDTIDLTDHFRGHPDPGCLFVEGALGPHVSDVGNMLIAQVVHKWIQSESLGAQKAPSHAYGGG